MVEHCDFVEQTAGKNAYRVARQKGILGASAKFSQFCGGVSSSRIAVERRLDYDPAILELGMRSRL